MGTGKHKGIIQGCGHDWNMYDPMIFLMSLTSLMFLDLKGNRPRKSLWRSHGSVIPGRASYPTDREGRKILLTHHKTVKRASYPHQQTQSHFTGTNSTLAINKSNTLWRKYSNRGPAFLSALRRWQECCLWKQVWLCLSTEGLLWIADEKHVLAVGIVFCLASYVPLLHICLLGNKHHVQLHLL